jgi:hypothetical protein
VINPAISARLLTNADTTWLSAMFHPRSRNDQGDYCRQADLMSAQRLVCLRHDAGNTLIWESQTIHLDRKML